MTGNDNIVKAILTDANAYADAVSVEAHKNAEKLSVEAKAYRDETVRAAKAEAEKEGAAIVKNRLTLLNLDVNKLKLGAKREVLDGVYARVLEKLNSLKKADALKIIDGLILNNAKSGETVLVSGGAATVKDVEALGSVKKLNLKVEKADGFTGGVKLKGAGYVTDLTFGALQADIRRSTEAEIAEKLF